MTQPEVDAVCLQSTNTQDILQKKMIYNFIVYYAEQRAELAIMTVNTLVKAFAFVHASYSVHCSSSLSLVLFIALSAGGLRQH